MLFIPYFITFVYLLEYLFGFINECATKQYIFFILWPTSAIMMGIYVSKENRYKYFVKFLDIIMLLFSIAGINVMIDVSIMNLRANLGGAIYQFAGYVISIAYGINLYFLNHGYHHERFKITKNNLYTLLCYFLLIIQIIAVIATGARGPMILIFVYSLFIILSVKVHSSKYKQMLKLLSVSFLLLTILLLLWPKLVEIDAFRRGWERTFSYIS